MCQGRQKRGGRPLFARTVTIEPAFLHAPIVRSVGTITFGNFELWPSQIYHHGRHPTSYLSLSTELEHVCTVHHLRLYTIFNNIEVIAYDCAIAVVLNWAWCVTLWGMVAEILHMHLLTIPTQPPLLSDGPVCLGSTINFSVQL